MDSWEGRTYLGPTTIRTYMYLPHSVVSCKVLKLSKPISAGV